MLEQLKLYAGAIKTVALVLAGFALAWTIQGWRLDAANAKYDKFVIQTEALGKEAERKAEAQRLNDIKRKEQADAENKHTIDSLRADNKRLRNERAAGSYVPPAGPGASRPDLACFDRTELESALRQLDEEVSGLIGEGAEAVGDLNTAKTWAQKQ